MNDNELQEALEALDWECPTARYVDGTATRRHYEAQGWDMNRLPVDSLAIRRKQAAAILAHIDALVAEIEMFKKANAAWQKESEIDRERIEKPESVIADPVDKYEPANPSEAEYLHREKHKMDENDRRGGRVF